MSLLRFFPVKLVDRLCLLLAELRFGNTSRYGLVRPNNGPFLNKLITGRSATIDVGCVGEIKSGKIQVVTSIKRIEGKTVEFIDGNTKNVDSIVFATGYKSSVSKWLEVFLQLQTQKQRKETLFLVFNGSDVIHRSMMEICSTRMGCRNASSRITGRGRMVCIVLALGNKAWLVFQEMLGTLLETLILWFVGEAARTSFPNKLELFLSFYMSKHTIIEY